MPWTQAPVRVLLPTLYFLTLDLFKCDELCTLLCYLDALQDVSIIALLLVVQEAVKRRLASLTKWPISYIIYIIIFYI